MSNLKQIITEYLDNRNHVEALMNSNYTTSWENEPDDGDYTPFDFRSVVSYGGGEDCGSEYYNVIELRLADSPDETLFVRIDGWYHSYEGIEYEKWRFVEPKQKTITVYE